MFRDLEDYNRGFNCFAIALYKTNSTGLVESIMSTHEHLLVQTDSPKDFMMCLRMLYTTYFNKKYGRYGKLGEKQHYTIEIVGYHHMLAAMSYVLRNALHHGVAPIPYAYPHCSANAIFMQEMGKRPEENLLPQKSYYKFLGRTAEYPNSYKMSKSGVFLRESVLDIPQVENLFVTPRMFNYYMSRKSSEEWEAEQSKDQNNSPLINIQSIENGEMFSDNELQEVAKDSAASIKLFEIMARGIYEKDGHKFRLNQKQRLALATTLEKISEIRLDLDVKKTIQSQVQENNLSSHVEME